ncbi:hypothetical protein BKP35_04085 [Anaerobacillus arseniciselenatis]|uniref:DUF3679 domain-containing protein n=1 Tax=Anaerobacillus arseniciselenatis TaxID=85682 RepID=A0A1S2LY44_9BACI|nr:hypothetical protein BKP35_04085 [Anaerobacillus arseniciselenatis]
MEVLIVTKFFLKCFFITTILFLGILVGIQMASNNIVKMTGDESYSTATIIKNNDVTTSEVINEDDKITSHDLQEKQQQLEQIETFNLFSQMGVKLSDALDHLFSNILTKITNSVASVLT